MTAPASATAKPTKAGRLIFRPQVDRVLIYNADTDELFTLWPLGVEILQKCDGTRSPQQIANEALDDKPYSPARREAIIGRFLGELEQRHLLTWQAGDEGSGPEA